MSRPYDVVILGLSVTSSWGNGHATTYRSLIRGLAARGRRVLFLERNMPWYAGNRDAPHPAGARTELYETLEDLPARFERSVSEASMVIVGSFVPDGVRVGEWVNSVARGVTAFYDIDTPVTLARLAGGCHDYISPELIRRYHMYLSFTGGPTLREIESRYGSRMARALYCSVNPLHYRPQKSICRWDLGYLGTYSDDRQATLERIMLEPAREWPLGRFAVVGPMYPQDIRWPSNVDREIHLSPREHPAFYSSQRYTLNVTREAMRKAGYSPSVRLFEAGACGVPVISDWWEGLDSFFEVGREILVSTNCEDTLRLLRKYPEAQRREIGAAARRRILAQHTPIKRAGQLEHYLKEAHDHVSPHTTRRHGCHRPSAGRMAIGMASECPGQGAMPEAGGQAREVSAASSLHEPARTGR